MSTEHRTDPVAGRTGQGAGASTPRAAATATAATDLRTVLCAIGGQRRRTLLAGMALAALTVAMGMALLGLSGWFITATAIAGLSLSTALAFDVFVPSAGIRLLAVGRTFTRYGERVFTHDATLAALATLRLRLFAGWSAASGARELLARPARALFRLTSDVDALDGLYLRLIVPAACALLAWLAAGALLAWYAPWAGLSLFLWLALASALVLLHTGRAAARSAARRALALEALRSRTIDLVSGQVELAMAGRLALAVDGIERLERRLAAADLAGSRVDARAAFLLGAVQAVALAALIPGVGAWFAAGRIDAPQAMLVLLFLLGAAEPLAALRRGAVESGRMLVAVRRTAPRLRAGTAPAKAAAPHEAALRLEQAGWTPAGSGRPVLHAMTLRIDAGERVAVLGASGAGKSSLLALIAGEADAWTGRVEAPASAWLVQRSDIFRDSVRENLRLANPRADEARLWRALADAGLADHVHTLPRGLDTPLGEQGLGLSGGQARRLALARLFLHPAPLWLLDEPTEGLDAATARDVLARLAEHAHGRTLLIATHLRREAQLADRLLILSDGRLLTDARRGEPAFERGLRDLRPD
ncbi:ATP-binding cassette domain-containing protein [Verticiella sediminum]|uniref:ATP-binding cassette domain-containing protein n=1 Tax=Verticiella sediminum TaxID=1247510 RepID=A0A556AS55_9BURK|nr:ATP-binding cassette domain-containing protein [Verticiella sediminum]TSH95763.1 ATP-binding cassette domain-containing protein [Verticiella sediminum]